MVSRSAAGLPLTNPASARRGRRPRNQEIKAKSKKSKKSRIQIKSYSEANKGLSITQTDASATIIQVLPNDFGYRGQAEGIPRVSYGRGRRDQGKDTTDQYHALDIRLLHRRGDLRSGSPFTLGWSWNGTPTGNVVGCAKEDSIVLCHTCRRSGGEDSVFPHQLVRLTWTVCRYGGRRPWFICPVRDCGRRVAVLYGGGVFACRHCYRLAYGSQRETADYRALRRAQRIRMRLGGSGRMSDEFPPKPKGMHWRTYRRLQTEAENAASFSWQSGRSRVLRWGG